MIFQTGFLRILLTIRGESFGLTGRGRISLLSRLGFEHFHSFTSKAIVN